MSDIEIVKILIEELENQKLLLRALRGYGVGHPRIEKTGPKQVLGKSMYPDEEIEKEEEDQSPKKVQVSKAFRKISFK